LALPMTSAMRRSAGAAREGLSEATMQASKTARNFSIHVMAAPFVQESYPILKGMR
jgi:hypothetical protein